MKKWMIGVISSVILIPAVAFSWKNIQQVWAVPERVEQIAGEVEGYSEEQKSIQKLVLEQHARQERQEAVNKAQIDALNQQLMLIAEMKKKK